MYKRDRAKTIALYLAGGVAIGASLALIVWFIFILHLRTEYREFCLEVNRVMLSTPADQRFLQRGDEVYPLSTEAMDFYDKVLLADGATVFARKTRAADDRSIVLLLGENRLTLTGLEDGSLINLHWETPEGSVGYNIRSDQVSFMQLTAYFSNYARRVGT